MRIPGLVLQSVKHSNYTSKASPDLHTMFYVIPFNPLVFWSAVILFSLTPRTHMSNKPVVRTTLLQYKRMHRCAAHSAPNALGAPDSLCSYNILRGHYNRQRGVPHHRADLRVRILPL